MMVSTSESGWQWVSSDGGPLLLVPSEYLPFWGGIVPPNDGRIIEAKFRWDGADSTASDYDRACDVDGYLGVLEIGVGWGLIFGGEEGAMTWRPEPHFRNGDSSPGGVFIRWVYANSETDLIQAAASVPESLWTSTDSVLLIGHEPLYVLHAANTIPFAEDNDHLKIHLASGNYVVATAEYQPDKHTSVIVHKLTRMDRSDSSPL